MKKKEKELKHKEKKEEQAKKINKDVKDEEKLSEELEKLKEANAELRDTLLRKVAEFENYKRRTLKTNRLTCLNIPANILLPVFYRLLTILNVH